VYFVISLAAKFGIKVENCRNFLHSVQYFGPFLHFQNVSFYVLSQNMLGYIPLNFELSDAGLLASVMGIFGLFCTFYSPKWK